MSTSVITPEPKAKVTSPLVQTAVEQIAFFSESRQHSRVQATIVAFPGTRPSARKLPQCFALVMFCRAMIKAAHFWYEDHHGDAKVQENMRHLAHEDSHPSLRVALLSGVAMSKKPDRARAIGNARRQARADRAPDFTFVAD
jgi:hypothetical protein